MQSFKTIRKFVSITGCGSAMALIIGLMLSVACQKPELPPRAYEGPTLTSENLGLTQAVQAPANGFVLLNSSPSTGRFPAALAVVRLDKPNPLFVYDQPLFVSERGWEVAKLPTEEAVWWNSLLKTVPKTRTVNVFDRTSVISPDCSLQEVLAATRRIRVELCLIYGPRPMVDKDSAGLAGVVIDANSGQYLAYIQSSASPLDFEPQRPDRLAEDLSHQDVNAIAARRFEQHAKDCIVKMIDQDQPSPTTQPSPWNTKDSWYNESYHFQHKMWRDTIAPRNSR